MATLRLKNVSPLGDIELPVLGRVGSNPLKAGEEFDCPAGIAGRAPGTWREPTDAERAENLAGLTKRTVGEAPNLRLEVECPGYGLLAQVANFVLVQVPAAAKKTAQAPAGVTTEEK